MIPLGVWQSIMDSTVGKVLPFYGYYGLIYKLLIIVTFVLIAKMSTDDRRVIILAGLLGALFAFGYLPMS